MSYSVKECYFTLQGEGAQAGRAAIFLRFAGCNLWSGREDHRDQAVCTFCDTDFVGTDGPGGGKFKVAGDLASHVRSFWPKEVDGEIGTRGTPYVVCTGGEPLLQLDRALIDALHQEGLEVGVETNGTLVAPAGLDWICVSPKSDAPLKQQSGHEIKLVYPQDKASPEGFAGLDFDHFFLQPLDGPEAEASLKATLHYCHTHPQWRLSLQTHKLIGIP